MSTGLQDFDHSEKSPHLEQLFRQAAAVVAQLQRAVSHHTQHVEFAVVRDVLESLPCATSEFALACRRLDNADHYHRPGRGRHCRLRTGTAAKSLVRESHHGGR